MPLLIPVLAASTGFFGGMFVSDGFEKVTRTVVVLGAGYLIYTKVIK